MATALPCRSSRGHRRSRTGFFIKHESQPTALLDLGSRWHSIAHHPEKDQRGENAGVEREVPRQRQVSARVSKAAAGDIDPASFRRDRCTDENDHECGRNRKRTGEEAMENEREAAK